MNNSATLKITQWLENNRDNPDIPDFPDYQSKAFRVYSEDEKNSLNEHLKDVLFGKNRPSLIPDSFGSGFVMADYDDPAFICKTAMDIISKRSENALREMSVSEMNELESEYPWMFMPAKPSEETSADDLRDRLETAFNIAHTGRFNRDWLAEKTDLLKRESEPVPNAVMPKRLTSITLPEFQNALTHNKEPVRKNQSINAYVSAVVPVDPYDDEDVIDTYPKPIPNIGLEIKNNEVYLGGKLATEARFEDIYGKEIIDDQRLTEINVQALNIVYSIVYKNIWSQLPYFKYADSVINYSVDIYLPDLMRYLGISYHKENEERIVKWLQSFHNIMGVIVTDMNTDHPSKDRHLLLTVESVLEKNNTIRVKSPYINTLITILNGNRFDQNLLSEKVKLLQKENFTNVPSHSNLIKPSIIKEKNKRAIEVVDVIIKLIEQAGSNQTPHISVQTILDRCPALRVSFHAFKSNGKKKQLLQRTFLAAWDYLKKDTLLEETYKDIKYPAKEQLEQLSVKKLRDTVFEFPHKGKIKSADEFFE